MTVFHLPTPEPSPWWHILTSEDIASPVNNPDPVFAEFEASPDGAIRGYADRLRSGLGWVWYVEQAEHVIASGLAPSLASAQVAAERILSAAVAALAAVEERA